MRSGMVKGTEVAQTIELIYLQDQLPTASTMLGMADKDHVRWAYVLAHVFVGDAKQILKAIRKLSIWLGLLLQTY